MTEVTLLVQDRNTDTDKSITMTSNAEYEPSLLEKDVAGTVDGEALNMDSNLSSPDTVEELHPNAETMTLLDARHAPPLLDPKGIDDCSPSEDEEQLLKRCEDLGVQKEEEQLDGTRAGSPAPIK